MISNNNQPPTKKSILFISLKTKYCFLLIVLILAFSGMTTHAWARYYDPALGRFISPDSVIPDVYNPQAMASYSYVVNSPLNYSDPSGHMFEKEIEMWRKKYNMAERAYCRVSAKIDIRFCDIISENALFVAERNMYNAHNNLQYFIDANRLLENGQNNINEQDLAHFYYVHDEEHIPGNGQLMAATTTAAPAVTIAAPTVFPPLPTATTTAAPAATIAAPTVFPPLPTATTTAATTTQADGLRNRVTNFGINTFTPILIHWAVRQVPNCHHQRR